MSRVGTMAKDHIMREVDRRVNPNTHLGKQVENIHKKALGYLQGGTGMQGVQYTGQNGGGIQRPPQSYS